MGQPGSWPRNIPLHWFLPRSYQLPAYLEMAGDSDVRPRSDDGEGGVVGDLLTSAVQPLNCGQRQTSPDARHVA